MGWGSFTHSITKPFKKVASDVKESWDDLRSGDIIGFVENGFQAAFGFGFAMTGIPSISGVLQDALTPEIPGAPPTEYQDRKRMSNGAANPRRIIYGQARVGGQVVYWESSGTDDAFMHVIVVLAAHSCKEVGDVYFGDKLAFIWNGSTHVSQGEFVGKAIMFFETGKQTAANASIVADTPANWDNTHKLLDQTYAYFKLSYDKEVYSGGIPNISIVIKGKDDIWDPRTSTFGYTDNHSLCCLDYLMWESGLRATADEVNIDSFKDGADISDELVASGPGLTEKRYTVNGSMSFQSPMLDNFKAMLSSGSALCPSPNGTFTYIPGIYIQPIILDLNESDLISSISFTPGSGKNSRYNYAKGTFVDPANDYELVEFVQLPVEGYIERDGEELIFDNSWPLTNSGTTARRLSKIAIENSRFGLTVQATFKYNILNAIIGDRITLSIAGLGWTQKIFRIIELSFGIMSGVKVTLREDNEDVWDWQEGDALEVPVPPALNLPNPLIVSAPTNIQFTESLYSTNAKTQTKVLLTLTWEAGASAVSYDIQHRIPGGSWIADATFWNEKNIGLRDFELGEYQFRVRSTNGIGKTSEWTSGFYTVLGKLLPPPDVSGIIITDGILSWTYHNAPIDFLGFNIRTLDGGGTTWGTAVPAHEGYITATSWDVSNQLGGTKTFFVKAIDTSLIESENASFVITGLGDPVINNIILSQEYKGLGWPGEIIYGDKCLREFFYLPTNTLFYPIDNSGIYGDSDLIDGNGDITGLDQGLYYGPERSFIYPETNVLYYSTSYLDLIYDFSYTVNTIDIGSQLVVSYETTADTTFLQRFALNSKDENTLSPFGGVIKTTEAGEYRFRLFVPGGQDLPTPKITSVVITLDVVDITESFNDIAVSVAGTRLPITKQYRGIKYVGLTIQDDGSGVVALRIKDRDNILGPLIDAIDATGINVSTLIDADIRGF